MKENKGKIAFALVCAVLGFIISMQFKTVSKTTEGGFLSTQRAQQLTVDLKNLRTEKERLNQELTDLERRLKEYEQTEADENYIIRNLRNDLEKYQILSGHRSVEGPGIIVTLEDLPSEYPSDTSFLEYHYEYIVYIINKLNSAMAEAISINDQRFLANTEVYYSSNAVFINSVPVKPPFEIKAIGNPDTLEAAMNMRFGFVYNVREQGMVRVNVKKQSNIVLPRHTVVTKFRFAKPIETTE